MLHAGATPIGIDAITTTCKKQIFVDGVGNVPKDVNKTKELKAEVPREACDGSQHEIWPDVTIKTC